MPDKRYKRIPADQWNAEDYIDFHKDTSDSFGNTGWHTEKLGLTLGFSDDDIHVIKSEVNRTFQSLFGGRVALNTPEQFAVKQTGTRLGDPSGFIGLVFKVARRGYYALEHVPLVNDLRLWAVFDRVVLCNNTNPTVQAYVAALRGFQTADA